MGWISPFKVWSTWMILESNDEGERRNSWTSLHFYTKEEKLIEIFNNNLSIVHAYHLTVWPTYWYKELKTSLYHRKTPQNGRFFTVPTGEAIKPEDMDPQPMVAILAAAKVVEMGRVMRTHILEKNVTTVASWSTSPCCKGKTGCWSWHISYFHPRQTNE